jgi:hypothetical protein
MPALNTTEPDSSEIDPIWTTSRTARQIYALGEVDKVRMNGYRLYPKLCSSAFRT